MAPNAEGSHVVVRRMSVYAHFYFHSISPSTVLFVRVSVDSTVQLWQSLVGTVNNRYRTIIFTTQFLPSDPLTPNLRYSCT